MDITQWIITSLQINESVSATNLQISLTVNSFLFVCYLVVSVLTKRAIFMIAFFMSCTLFNMAVFDPLSESQLYALTFVVYSYVDFDRACNVFTTIACVIIIALIILLGYDAFFME